jgi:hypothetical protein
MDQCKITQRLRAEVVIFQGKNFLRFQVPARVAFYNWTSRGGRRKLVAVAIKLSSRHKSMTAGDHVFVRTFGLFSGGHSEI